MSAGRHGEYPGEPPITVISSLDGLAPKFRERLEAFVADCQQQGLDIKVHETFRSNETQAVYYARGRTTIPPHETVTNARTNRYSWHGYELAADCISASHGWDVPESWWNHMGAIAEQHGLEWGGRWKMKDRPHVQFGGMHDTPSDHARELLDAGGLEAVWRAVGAQ